MIVADTSAILAIMFAEPERERFLQTIQAARTTLISTVSWIRWLHPELGKTLLAASL